MALILTPGGELRSGSVGSTNYSRSAYGAIMRAKANPVNPNTSGQLAVRQAMAAMSTIWATTLTAAERDSWEQYAQETPIPGKFGTNVITKGRQMYLRLNIARYVAGLTPNNVAPVTPGVAPATGLTLTADTTDGIVVTAAEAPYGMDDLIYIRLGNPVNLSKNFYKSPFRVAGLLEVIGDLPITLRASTSVAIGQRYFYAWRLFSGDGKVSFEQIDHVEITA